MRKSSTELLEQGTQTPSPAPDLIPAEAKNQPRTHIGIGTVNGGTSIPLFHPISHIDLTNVPIYANDYHLLSMWFTAIYNSGTQHQNQ